MDEIPPAREKQRPVREKSPRDGRPAGEGWPRDRQGESLPFTPSLRLHTHLHSLPFDLSLHIIHQPPGHPEARGPTIPFPSINHNQSGIMRWSPTIHRSPHSSHLAFTARPLTITSPSTRSPINPPSSLPSPIHLPTHSLSAIPSSFHIPHPPPTHPPCTRSLCSPVHPPIHLYLVITLFTSSQPPPFC